MVTMQLNRMHPSPGHNQKTFVSTVNCQPTRFQESPTINSAVDKRTLVTFQSKELSLQFLSDPKRQSSSIQSSPAGKRSLAKTSEAQNSCLRKFPLCFHKIHKGSLQVAFGHLCNFQEFFTSVFCYDLNLLGGHSARSKCSRWQSKRCSQVRNLDFHKGLCCKPDRIF